MANDVLRDVLTWNGRHLAAELLGKAQQRRQPILVLLGHAGRTRGLDMKRRPGRAEPVGQSPRIADTGRPARMRVDADENPFARRPGPGYGVGLHVGQQLLVDALGGAAQRQFPQRRQIARREIVLDRALGGAGNIDLALLAAA